MSNLSQNLDCTGVPNGTASFSDCYMFFLRQNPIAALLEYALFFGILVPNILVISMIVSRLNKNLIFDKLLLINALTDVMGSVDLPFYHIFTMFNYWPFGRLACILWNTLDSTLNSTIVMHMLFMSWVRLASMLHPLSFKEQWLARHPYLVSVLMWLAGLSLWLTLNLVFIYFDVNYQEYTCSYNYQPPYLQFVFTLVAWFIPLVCILCITLYIMRLIANKERTKPSASKSSSTIDKLSSRVSLNLDSRLPGSKYVLSVLPRIKLDAQAKLSIIIGMFLVQWIPSCLIWMINSLCSCVPNTLATFTYWLTFSAVCVDPLLVLLLNPNFSAKVLKSKI